MPQKAPSSNPRQQAARKCSTTMVIITGKRSPLGAKPVNINTPFRLKLKALGYDIIPVWDGKAPKTNWPREHNDEAAIRRWGGVATGIRTKGNDTVVFDLDILIEAARDEILAAYEKQWPEFMARCLRRHAGQVKIALIGRCNTAKRFMRSGRFSLDPETDRKGNQLEIFTRNDTKQVVVQGKHSPGHEYGYVGPAIWETPLEALPWFPDDGFHDALVIAQEVMEAHGLVKIEKPINPNSGGKVFDLKPEQIFTLTDGEKISLKDLEEIAGVGRITGYADLWDPTTGTSKHSSSRVLVGMSNTGLRLYDTKEQVSHRWAHRGPQPDILRERMKALMARMAAQPEVRK